jgi:hypothetical protein
VLIVKILILSDGKYGDRAIIVIKKKFPEAELILLEQEDPTMFLDEVILKNDVELAIEHADLLILYVRHPDVVMEIASREKPTILAINFGLGFLNQALELNPKIIMPISMCNALPDTGIDEIDRYFEKFGTPIYKIKLEYTDNLIPIVKEAEIIVESPCGASKASIDLILGKQVTPETLNSFAINIRQECREPVSVLLSQDEMSDSSAVKHLLNLLEAIENEDPSLFLPNTPLGEYTVKRREEFKTKSLKYLF